ncbi:hypothetical protein MPSEU_000652100 [Mayamaea pseudoterrestris]|nr:hypothetical protein MPSEU_000652100 [Mayamaea pseudoterrestris]
MLPGFSLLFTDPSSPATARSLATIFKAKHCSGTEDIRQPLKLERSDHVWVVRRKDTGQLATMGGFVMVGETVEHAVKRELKEETGIDVELFEVIPNLFGVYSDPRRDNRRHTVSVVYVVHLDGSEQPKAADDVKDVMRIHLDEVDKYEYFADHRTILMDYQKLVRNGKASQRTVSDGDIASNVARSMCSTDAIVGAR